MDFKHPDGRSVAVVLPERSLLVMKGEGRYLWTHGWETGLFFCTYTLNTIYVQIYADNQTLNTYMFFGFLLDFVFHHYKYYLMNIIIQYVQKVNYIIL